jgi:transcriptional regulator with XRE-family HTH domain
VNIDQETLAAAAGVSRKAVISLERDESETMDYRRLDVLQKLRRVLEEKWGVEFVRESRSSKTGVVLRKAESSAACSKSQLSSRAFRRKCAIRCPS